MPSPRDGPALSYTTRIVNPSRILTNTLAHGSSQLCERASSLVLTLLVARTLGAKSLGIYATAIVVGNLVRSAADMGWSTLLTREIAKDRASASRYLLHAAAIVA